MPTKFVEAGGWRTLETFWNTAEVVARFRLPSGAQIKVRYGNGWPIGFDRQKQTLDGLNDKDLSIGRGSLVVARMQIKVPYDTNVSYEIFLPGP